LPRGMAKPANGTGHGTADTMQGAHGAARLARAILAHVREAGGCTIDPRGNGNPATGYLVALPAADGCAASTSWDGNGAGILPLVASWIERIAPRVLTDPDLFVGAWIDAGKLYLDVSQWIAGATDALRAGRERDQIAIWDVTAATAILTGGTGATAHAA